MAKHKEEPAQAVSLAERLMKKRLEESDRLAREYEQSLDPRQRIYAGS